MPNKIQIKISLYYIKPIIWRRIVVSENITFKELHETIQVAMGWRNVHLFSFNLDGKYVRMPFEDNDVINAATTKLKGVFNKKNASLTYQYDFGDSWDHQLLIEKVEPIKPTEKLPKCLGGERNCPPEDCGSFPGYENLVEIMKDKKHPEYKEMVSWLGGVYNPEKFSLAAINKRLVKMS